MKIERFDRKAFSVDAVQVTYENINDVAKWCKGTVIKQQVKMLGVPTELPGIRVDGQGDNRGRQFIATFGCYVVELKGSYRVYKPAQFASTFEPAVEVEHLIEDEVLETVDDTFDDNASVA